MKSDKTKRPAMAIALSKKKMMKDECPDCRMAMGGRCYAHGGEVKGEGSVLDEVLRDRRQKRMSEGGEVDSDELDADAEPDFEKRMDLEPVHSMEDEEHDAGEVDHDDESLVGQVMRERRKSRMRR